MRRRGRYEEGGGREGRGSHTEAKENSSPARAAVYSSVKYSTNKYEKSAATRRGNLSRQAGACTADTRDKKKKTAEGITSGMPIGLMASLALDMAEAAAWAARQRSRSVPCRQEFPLAIWSSTTGTTGWEDQSASECYGCISAPRMRTFLNSISIKVSTPYTKYMPSSQKQKLIFTLFQLLKFSWSNSKRFFPILRVRC